MFNVGSREVREEGLYTCICAERVAREKMLNVKSDVTFQDKRELPGGITPRQIDRSTNIPHPSTNLGRFKKLAITCSHQDRVRIFAFSKRVNSTINHLSFPSLDIPLTCTVT